MRKRKLTICYIKDEYIEYLQKFDDKVYYNKNSTRPYLGIILEINDFKYYAPLSSPKLKHQGLRESIKYEKINDGKYGLLNISNMIPVQDKLIMAFDINQIKDYKYKNILISQLRYLKANKNKIFKKALKLYKLITSGNEKLKKSCCDYSILESKIQNYN